MFLQEIFSSAALLFLFKDLVDCVPVACGECHDESFPPEEQRVEFKGVRFGEPRFCLIESACVPGGLYRATEVIGTRPQPCNLSRFVSGPVGPAQMYKCFPEVGMGERIPRKNLQE